MFDFSALLTKPMVIIIVVLSTTCVGLGTYSWYLGNQKDKIAHKLAVTEQQLINLDKQAKIERDLYKTTLDALKQREIDNSRIALENDNLRDRLREILRDEEDACLVTPLPDSIIRLLLAEAQDSGSPATDIPPRAAP